MLSYREWGLCAPDKYRKLDQIKPEVRDAIRRVVSTHQGRRSVSVPSPWPLVLHGSAGTGKSCAGLCLLDYARKNQQAFPGYPAYVLAADWVSAHTLARLGQYEPRGCRSPIYEPEMWEWWKSRSIPCLDELGTRGQVTDTAYEILKKTIDEREGRPLIVVSNLNLNQLAAVYDDRIASRLAAGTVIEVTGEDRRITQKPRSALVQ